ncbi:MAG: methyltransferase domain-containing protein [Gammaproteobacteria bacterium]|nr:methyltransferase domain-containing protein [Gammaproteobacteria bacterium]
MQDSNIRTEDGSYHVSSFSANTKAEIRRLDAQVDLFWPTESALIARYGLEDGMDYLDCGCGPGRLMELLKGSFPALKCTGLEMDPILVEAATQMLSGLGLSNCNVVQGTAENPNLPEKSFDFITMRLVLEHVPDPVTALQSLRRLLRPGGRLLIISNDFENHTRTWPPVPELDALYDAYRAHRSEDQGDPCIGRRVPRLLATAGFAVIAQEIEVAHNVIAGDEAFFRAEGVGIPAQLVSDGFLEQSVFESMIRSWKEMLTDPDHCITRQLCVAVGEAQSDEAIKAAAAKAAAAPVAKRQQVDDSEFVPPGSELEKKLGAMWCQAMNLDRVSIRSNFFDLGGNSLLLEQLHAKLQADLGYDEPITTLFQYPTIEMLAEYLAKSPAGASKGPAASAGPGKRTFSGPKRDIREAARRRRGALGLRNPKDSD